MRLRPVPVLLFAAVSASAGAVELPADCKAVFAAMEKSVLADHTTTSTHGASTTHGVTVGGAMYIEVRGAWRKSPVTAKEVVAQSRENLKNASSFACKALPDSTVDGVRVSNVATRTVSEDSTVDSTVSIAKDTGLAVQVDNRMSDDPGAHLVTHYGYANVKAPI